MKMIVVGFVPPIIGVDDKFNTLRIGGFYTKNLKVGDEVLLLNERERVVFGKATVESLDQGRLDEMCVIHGHANHTELANDPVTAPERLFRTIQRIYGPHIAEPTKKTTVVYLRRTE